MSDGTSNSELKKIHVVFKTHLDVGFTDFAAQVTKRYFEDFIPKALHLARSLRETSETDRFVWTTGSWLIYEYLEQASPQQRREMEAAIEAGDLVWHGLPFTLHSELMDASLFRYGLSLSQQLDRRFGRQTIAAKMTDVPGHTRGIVPLLAEAGIQFLHIGVNLASTPPAVPPVFVWTDPAGAKLMVMYQSGYGAFARVPGCDEALYFAHTNDNLGPPAAAEITAMFARLRGEYGVEVCASSMDAFAHRLATVKESLPVVNQEIGDTWIHGVGTDPLKVAQFRELLRLRRRWCEDRDPSSLSPELASFSRGLLLVPEHTWGLDIKTHLHDDKNFSKSDFTKARSTPNFQKVEASWQEQRNYIQTAVKALGSTPWGDEVRTRLEALTPAKPQLNGFVEITARPLTFDLPQFSLGIDDQTGAITHLISKSTGQRWASARHPLAQMRYEVFSQADYDRFVRQYNKRLKETAEWAIPDYTKPGMAAAISRPFEATFSLDKIYQRRADDADELIVCLSSDPIAAEQYGCPRQVIYRLTAPHGETALYLDAQWFGKDASRLPEAIWLSFNPIIGSGKGWKLHKLRREISPTDVARDGNRRLHAVMFGVLYRDQARALSIQSLDAPLVAFGRQALLNFSNRFPSLTDGVHFNLYNNVWGTNFGMWYDDDARFRFALTFNPPAE